jgi:hypothetical protein
VVDAVDCAVAVQAVMAERNEGVPQDRRMLFRIGVCWSFPRLLHRQGVLSVPSLEMPGITKPTAGIKTSLISQPVLRCTIKCDATAADAAPGTAASRPRSSNTSVRLS